MCEGSRDEDVGGAIRGLEREKIREGKRRTNSTCMDVLRQGGRASSTFERLATSTCKRTAVKAHALAFRVHMSSPSIHLLLLTMMS
jgi:hypothetical protein